MSEEAKIFDESHVECNDCKHYWDDSCSGVPEGSKRSCTAFQATRRTNIPKEIERLKERISQAHRSILLLNLVLLLHLLVELYAKVSK